MSPSASLPTPRTTGARGRPVATSHGLIEQAAFALFAERGFTGTTMEAIAAAVGVGRRTLFRYYPSKNDIPWGQFDDTLSMFRTLLDHTPVDVPLHAAVHGAVLDFNDFPAEARPSHRERMQLILGTPELQAHSALRFTAWRRVIEDYVAERTGLARDALLPVTVGRVSLALSLAAYEVWLADATADLHELLDRSMGELQGWLAT